MISIITQLLKMIIARRLRQHLRSFSHYITHTLISCTIFAGITCAVFRKNDKCVEILVYFVSPPLKKENSKSPRADIQ